MNTYENIDRQLNVIKYNAGILAKGVKKVLRLELPESFLETIYIPFIGFILKFNLIDCNTRLGVDFIENFDELTLLVRGKECLGNPDILLYNIEVDTNSYDFISHARINIYEKIIFKIYGISHSELKNIKPDKAINYCHDIESRVRLRKYIKSFDVDFPDLINLIPLTLFEGLKEKKIDNNIIPPKCHWLGQIYNENYIFYLATLKEKKTIIIGQPHGGTYCQIQHMTASEAAERLLTDIYHIPSWDFRVKSFPNWRASRNRFLQLKNIVRKKNNKEKMLVVLSYFYIDNEPRAIDNITGDLFANDFYISQLKTLKSHFSESFDFKLYPRQNSDVLPKLEFLKQLFPDCEFIMVGSVLDNARHYEGVIHMDSYGTAVIELSTTRIPQYVYLGPEVMLNSEYELFLWDSKKASTRKDYSSGSYILIDNRKYRNAYGASFFYPFYFASLINRIKKNSI